MLQNTEQQQPALYICRHQKVLFHVFVAVYTDSPRELRMRKQVTNLERAPFDRMHQNSGELVHNLIWNSAHGAGNRRLPFPQKGFCGLRKAGFEASDTLLDR